MLSSVWCTLLPGFPAHCQHPPVALSAHHATLQILSIVSKLCASSKTCLYSVTTYSAGCQLIQIIQARNLWSTDWTLHSSSLKSTKANLVKILYDSGPLTSSVSCFFSLITSSFTYIAAVATLTLLSVFSPNPFLWKHPRATSQLRQPGRLAFLPSAWTHLQIPEEFRERCRRFFSIPPSRAWCQSHVNVSHSCPSKLLVMDSHPCHPLLPSLTHLLVLPSPRLPDLE